MFLRYKPEQILKIAQDTVDLDRYRYEISNENFLTIEVIRACPFNLGYLLAKLSRLNLVNMDICKLFDDLKYFKIDFGERVEEHELPLIRQYIEEAFDPAKKISIPAILIKQKDITIECNHSRNYAKMLLKTEDQKGLMAYLIMLFDSLGIDIATAKVHTQKNRVQDLFLIEKNGNFCHNVETIIKEIGIED
jgi:[protein-PII] uridylyltransferase